MNLNELKIGESARIISVSGKASLPGKTVALGKEALRQHLLDMGLIPGSKVTLLGRAPMGDPLEIRVQGYSLTLRCEEAAGVEVQPFDAAPQASGPTLSDDFSYDLSDRKSVV